MITHYGPIVFIISSEPCEFCEKTGYKPMVAWYERPSQRGWDKYDDIYMCKAHYVDTIREIKKRYDFA